MIQSLTEKEIEKIHNMCFNNPAKSCAIAQCFIDALQIVSCKTFANLQKPKKSPRTIQYQAEKLNGINIEKRKFISLIQ